MDWSVEKDGGVLLRAVVSEEFLSWLLPQIRDPVVARMDPYQDAMLDRTLQESWLRALGTLRAAAEAGLRAHHTAHSRLPRDPQIQERILSELVAKELEREPRWRDLQEIQALLELALESGAVVRTIGD
jgi:hypothetical protein